MNYRTIAPLVELWYFKSYLHEASCQSEKQVMAISDWSSGELYGPWASCLQERTYLVTFCVLPFTSTPFENR